MNVGSIRLSTHTGTHVDAPLHCEEGGGSVGRLPLEAFVGRAAVFDATESLRVDQACLSGLNYEHTTRILFKTVRRTPSKGELPKDYAAFDPALIAFLSSRGVVLIGTDAPSVDPVDSPTLPAHHALVAANIVSLENLSLGHVEPGEYELIALPLKIIDMDAAPVRAVLIRR